MGQIGTDTEVPENRVSGADDVFRRYRYFAEIVRDSIEAVGGAETESSVQTAGSGYNGHRKVSERMSIKYISAVTLAVRNMQRSVDFYQRLGFQIVNGGGEAHFTSLRSGEAFVNLSADSNYESCRWGRAIFRVDDADVHFEVLRSEGLEPDTPRDASWGERFFHVTDPDGHELSFAELLPSPD